MSVLLLSCIFAVTLMWLALDQVSEVQSFGHLVLICE